MRALVFLALACLVALGAGTGEENGALVEMMVAEEEGQAGDVVISGYNDAIPDFAFKDADQGQKTVTGESEAACAALCTALPADCPADSKACCKAYSYNAGTKSCTYGPETLTFDPLFDTKSKTRAGSSKEWRDYPGMTYSQGGWLKIEDKTLKECESQCEGQGDKCNMISYREEDKMCLLSAKSIDYSTGYKFYEKKGLVKSVMPLSKEGGVEQPSQDPDAGKAEMTEAEKQTAALEAEEKERIETAETEIKKAETAKEQSEQEVAAETKSAKAEVEQAKAEADAQEKANLEKFTEEATEQMKQKETEIKSTMAAAELTEEAKAAKDSAAAEQEQNAQIAADQKKYAEEASAARVAQAAEAAKNQVETAELQTAKSNADNEVQTAQMATAKAEQEANNAKDDVSAAKEQAEKAELIAANKAAADKAKIEADQKNAELNGQQEIEAERARQEALQAAQEKANGDEMKTELAETAKQGAADQAKQDAENAKALKDQEAQNKAAADKAEEEQQAAAKAEKEKTEAELAANKAAVDGQTAGAAAKLKEEQAINKQDEEFQREQLQEGIRAKLEQDAANESTEQKEAVARQAAEQVAAAGRREAEKAAQDAKDAADKKKETENAALAAMETEVRTEQNAEYAKTLAVKKEMEDKIAAEKAKADKEVKDVEDAAKAESAEVAAKAKADADAKIQKANADAKVIEEEAKQKGEEQAADIAVAADQAALVSTMRINADVATFVSSGLNPGTQSYQQLEANAKQSQDNLDASQRAADAAKEEADQAATRVAAAEKNVKQGLTATTPAVEQNIASQAVAAGAGNGAGRRLLDTKVSAAKARALKVLRYHKRRLLQAAAPENAGATNAGAQLSQEDLEKDLVDSKAAQTEAEATAEQSRTTANEAEAALQSNQAALNAANLLPANTAYGKLPEMYDHKGYLRVQSGGAMEQNAYIKIPTNTIPSTASIIGATLRMYKTGGGGGPAVVKLASCSWSRNTLTYTASETLPQGTVSEGVTAVFPEESDIYAAIMLKAAVVQEARANGDHICFEVSGGPMDEPAVLSSELTSKPPQLLLEIQSLPKSEEEKKAAEIKEKAAAAKLAKEAAVEAHLKEEAETKLTAAKLKEKAAQLNIDIQGLKAEAAKKEEEETTGAAFEAMKSALDAQKVQKSQTEMQAAEIEIKAKEEEELQKQFDNSPVVGAAREKLKTDLEAAKEKNIADKIAARRTEVDDRLEAENVEKLQKQIEEKKAAIATDLANKMAAATTAAASLTDVEKEAMQAAAAGEVATGMADYKAGKLEVAIAMQLGDPKEIAKMQASDAMHGLTENQRAALEAKVADIMAEKLPDALDAAVNAKYAAAKNKAVSAIESELKTQSNTKLAADIASQTAGKSETEAATIKTNLEEAAQTALSAQVSAKTSGEGLVALEVKVRKELSDELKPAVQASLKADVLKNQLAFAKMQAAQAATNVNEATKNNELGSALDTAKDFKPKQAAY